MVISSLNPPLLLTKVQTPHLRTNVIQRPRLTERLNAGLAGKLTLLSAPPGFGKTTLLGEWRAALPEYLATELLNVLARCTQSTIVILDNYEQITHPALLRIAEQAAEYAPPALHLVIATCRTPAPPLGRLRARRQLLEVRAADLAFTIEETTAHLSATGGMLDPAVCVALHRCTGGRGAGLRRGAALLAAGVPAAEITQRLEIDPVLARYLATNIDAPDVDTGRMHPLYQAFRRQTWRGSV